MKTKIIISLGILYFIALGKGVCQKLFKDIEFALGYSIQPQDRRLFQYPHSQEVIEMEKSRYDYQYDFLFNKSVFIKNKFNMSCGIGYSLFQSKFSRPFDHNYFTGGLTRELRHIGEYFTHSFKLANTLEFNLINHGKGILTLEMPVGLNFAFNKNIKASWGDWQENNWKFEFRNFEIYSGLKYQNGRFGMGFSYRIFNLQAIDRIIFNEILFTTANPSFLSKKIETINLNKIMISTGYQF